MRNDPPCECRVHGTAPYRIVVVHGGPGAAGSAREPAELAAIHAGTLEPFLLAPSLDGQLEQLARLIEHRADFPILLMGHSYGAMLGLVLAARRPDLVSRLVMVGSGVFTEDHAASIMETRLSRLSPEQRAETETLMAGLSDPATPGLDHILSRFGQLMALADGFDLLDHSPDSVRVAYDVFRAVWPEMAALRQSGELLELAARTRCPVLAIHGDHDPHPVTGVCAPLAETVADFRCHVLDRCGHEPWRERHARDPFAGLLHEEIARHVQATA